MFFFRIGKPAEVLTGVDDVLPLDLELGDSDASSSNFSSFVESVQTEKSMDLDNDSVLNEEIGETGSIRMNVYVCYWSAMGFLLTTSIFLSLVLMQTSRNMSDWWLSYWVSNSVNTTTNVTVGKLFLSEVPSITKDNSLRYYLIIYCVFAALNSTFTLFRAFLFAYGGLAAATKLHKLLLKSVVKVRFVKPKNLAYLLENCKLQAKPTFFDISPLGRILNRFSSDTYTIDDSLPFILNILLAQVFGLVGNKLTANYVLYSNLCNFQVR